MKTTVAILHYQRHLLPTGRLALQLLPGFQMDTLTYALKTGICLGLHMNELPCQFGSIGTILTIDDFYAMERNGILSLQVSGKDSYVVEKPRATGTGIQLADVTILPSWPEQILDEDEDANLLSEKLQSMFERYPELGRLHNYPNFESLTWLCQRWLELLPLPISEKQGLRLNLSPYQRISNKMWT